MKTKTCIKCGVEKTLTEFHKHPQMSDGHINECIICKRAYARELRRKSVELYREQDRQRAKLPARRKQYADKLIRQRKEKIGQSAAHHAVQRAIIKGTLRKPLACQRCKGTPVQGHHDDYSKPLSVMWLCPVCHAARHAELGRLRLKDD